MHRFRAAWPVGRTWLVLFLIMVTGSMGFVRSDRLPGPSPMVESRPIPDALEAKLVPLPAERLVAERVPRRTLIKPEAVTKQVPVLMYHEIGDVNNGNYVRQSEFEGQMQWLAEQGYHTVSLAELYHHFNDFQPLPAKPIVITFDDSYRSFYTIAIPILQRHHFRATNFVITGLVGKDEYMNWDQVQALPGLGMEIGSHTVTHTDLRWITDEKLAYELRESKRELEARTGVEILFFCYPAGRLAAQTPDAVKAASYLGAVTTASGSTTPEQSPFIWPRVRISRGDTMAAFARKVSDASSQTH